MKGNQDMVGEEDTEDPVHTEKPDQDMVDTGQDQRSHKHVLDQEDK